MKAIVHLFNLILGVIMGLGSPVSVGDCDLTVQHDGRLSIEATFTNRTDETFAEISVIAETSVPGYFSSPKVIVGPLHPRQRARLKALEAFALYVKPGYVSGKHLRVDLCYVQAVKFADGRLRILYNPL